MLIISICTIAHSRKRKTLARFAVDSYKDIVEIKSTECLIGKSMLCDVRVNGVSVAPQHAALILTDYGFKITPLSEDNKVYVNNCQVLDEAYLQSGDKITIGGQVLQIAINPAINTKAHRRGDKNAKQCRICNAVLLTLFQFFACLGYILDRPENLKFIGGAFGGIILCEWIYLLVRGFSKNVGVEIIGFFLTSVGFCVSASVEPTALIKKAVFFLVGFFMFIVLGLLLNNLNLVEKLAIPVMVLALLLLAFNVVFGISVYGSRNWVSIGGFSFQPSEFVKVAMVFVSACSLEKMMQLKNIISYLGFVFCCLVSLALMKDFGTAAVYFITLLVILCLRLCDIKFVVALGGLAVVGCALIVQIFPYISARFATYRHAWEYASSGGYQQTQTMMSIASGGLLGLGPGTGTLHNIPAADTDLVFGMVAEEWGLIFAVTVALMFVVLVFYSAVCIPRTRSIYYAVTSSAASCMFIFQTALNIFGSVDLLPLTGVTIPFVSNGGSSMLACWMLLSYIKTAGNKFVVLKK